MKSSCQQIALTRIFQPDQMVALVDPTPEAPSYDFSRRTLRLEVQVLPWDVLEILDVEASMDTLRAYGLDTRIE